MSTPTDADVQALARLHNSLVQAWRDDGPEAVLEGLAHLEPTTLITLLMLGIGASAQSNTSVQ